MLFTTIVATTLAATVSAFNGVTWKKGYGPHTVAEEAALNIASNVQVQPVYWSSAVPYTYDAFYAQIISPQSTFMSTMNQYLTVGTPKAFPGLTNTAGAKTGTVKVTAVQTYLLGLVSSGKLDPSGGSLYVPVHFPAGVTIQENTGLGLGNSCTSWCAYHYSVQSPKGWIYYGIIPEVNSGACAGGCGAAPTSFGNNCQVASHEFAEAITDPNQAQTGWTGPNGEIGDYCNDQESSVCGADGKQYFVQKLWSNSANACVAAPTAPTTCPNGVATGH
ncbi:hypothetical protein HDU98_000793 [Podochytrium sp. JEL0797]|nr:hypothetical protein HDU98_000793 [Podochytrium sp. JEL0797]